MSNQIICLKTIYYVSDDIKNVLNNFKKYLKKNGLLVVEIGNNQYIKVSNLLRQNDFKEVSKECDFNNNVRCIITTKK